MEKWYISVIEITGGFLPAVRLELPKGLTCIIGPRGSGKSTLIEAVRFVLKGLEGASRARKDLIAANLQNAAMKIITSESESRPGYLIQRFYGGDVVLTDTTGAAVTNVNLDRGTFLPLDAFSSGEIEEIADESFGEKRRAILDELRTDDLREIFSTISGLRRSLDGNAESVRNCQRRIDDLNEEIESLADVRTRTTEMPEKTPEESHDKLERAAEQQQCNLFETQRISEILEVAAQCKVNIREAIAPFLGILSKHLTLDDSSNRAAIKELQTSLLQRAASVNAQIAAIDSDLDSLTAYVRETAEKVKALHNKQHAEFVQLQAQDAEASKALADRTAAQQAVARLVGLENQLEKGRTELSALLEARESLKGEYLLVKERISSIRRDVASAIEKNAGPNVRFRVLQNADDFAYRQLLTEGLRGSRVRNHENIVDRLMCLRPEELAQMIHENDITAFEEQMALGPERSLRVLEGFRANLDPFALEIVDISDHVRIELNVGTEADPRFKDAAELSRGQKCTALLPLCWLGETPRCSLTNLKIISTTGLFFRQS